MDAKTLISTNRTFILFGTLTGGFLGLIYSILEYSLSDIPFTRLLVLGLTIGILIGLTVSLFESISGLLFKHRTFFMAVVIRTVIYLFIILGWLIIINTIHNFITYKTTVLQGLSLYVTYDSFIYNLTFALIGILLMSAFYQISKLHRKGELSNYILGKYHNPREVSQIFLFVDLKGSTKIAEQIGNLNYGKFLQEYYADITEAIHLTNATVYQYVGDEIILTWPMEKGISHNRCAQFMIEMRKTFDNYVGRYQKKYGFSPEFRAGLHGGKVLITWIGEVKKEIVFVGDVLNTTARIAEECKRAKSDFLLSGEIYSRLDEPTRKLCTFNSTFQPRGKEKEIEIYCYPIN